MQASRLAAEPWARLQSGERPVFSVAQRLLTTPYVQCCNGYAGNGHHGWGDGYENPTAHLSGGLLQIAQRIRRTRDAYTMIPEYKAFLCDLEKT